MKITQCNCRIPRPQVVIILTITEGRPKGWGLESRVFLDRHRPPEIIQDKHLRLQTRNAVPRGFTHFPRVAMVEPGTGILLTPAPLLPVITYAHSGTNIL